jgi:hypothetical protein
MAEVEIIRAFHVRFGDIEGRGLVVEAASFEAAAIAFLERDAPAGEDEAVVIVWDAESAHERCFRLDLASGVAKPC